MNHFNKYGYKSTKQWCFHIVIWNEIVIRLYRLFSVDVHLIISVFDYFRVCLCIFCSVCFSNHFVLINFYFNLFWKPIHFVIILMAVFRTRNFEYSSVYGPISTSRLIHLVIWGQVFSLIVHTWPTYRYWQIMSEIFSFLNFFE